MKAEWLQERESIPKVENTRYTYKPSTDRVRIGLESKESSMILIV